MKTSSNFSPPMVGGSSLFVIFAVLCLTVFTLLALSTAAADSRLANASSKAVTDYYAADSEAEAILASLRQGQIPEGVHADNNTYTYSCSISDTQELLVEVYIDNNTWTILRWQSVSTAQ